MFFLYKASKNISKRNVYVSNIISNFRLFECFNTSRRTFFGSGLNEIKKARNKVLDAEHKFNKVQSQMRQCQEKLISVQNCLKEIHSELPKLDRGDDKYLELTTKEYTLFQEENELLQQLQSFEKDERVGFSTYSAALSLSNRQQILRMQKNKNQPLVNAGLGLLVGSLGMFFFYLLQDDSSSSNEEAIQNGQASNQDQVIQAAKTQYGQASLFLSDLQDILAYGKTELPLRLGQEHSIGQNVVIDLDGIKRKHSNIDKDFDIIKKLLEDVTSEKLKPDNLVILGEELSNQLERMDGMEEWRIKKDAYGRVLVFSASGFLGFAFVYLLLQALA